MAIEEKQIRYRISDIANGCDRSGRTGRTGTGCATNGPCRDLPWLVNSDNRSESGHSGRAAIVEDNRVDTRRATSCVGAYAVIDGHRKVRVIPYDHPGGCGNNRS